MAGQQASCVAKRRLACAAPGGRGGGADLGAKDGVHPRQGLLEHLRGAYAVRPGHQCDGLGAAAPPMVGAR